MLSPFMTLGFFYLLVGFGMGSIFVGFFSTDVSSVCIFRIK